MTRNPSFNATANGAPPRSPLTSIEYEDITFQDWRAMWYDYIGANREKLSPKVHQFTYERIRDKTTSLRGFIVASTKPLGFVHYYFHPSSYNLTEACTIEDLYVSPESRGSGVGRWTIERVAEIAVSAGAPALHWKTAQSNFTAIALYRTLATQAEVLSFRRQL